MNERVYRFFCMALLPAAGLSAAPAGAALFGGARP